MPLVLFGLALAWAVMLLFGGTALDSQLLLFFHAGDAPRLGEAAAWLTELGGAWVLLPATALGALILLMRRDWRSAVTLAAVSLSGRLAVDLQKAVTGRVRPETHEHLVAVQSLSFPSAHAANSAMVWLLLALLLARGPRARALSVWAAVWLALAVGASRVVLGVHWPSDVIGGWAYGLFWTFLLLRLSGVPLGEGTVPPVGHSSPQRRVDMNDRNDRSEDRAETARRTDDSNVIDRMEGAPDFGDRQGQRPARDVGTRDELKQAVGDGGVTRVRGSDKKEDEGRPRFNEK